MGNTDFAAELQKIYNSEINITLSWFWDDGFMIRLGDVMNGFVAEANVQALADVLRWLQEAIAHFYPQSIYAQSLSPEIRDRAAARVFLRPQTGAREICPHCGSPNASHVMEQSFIFVCARCGRTVEVEQPKVQ